MTMCVAVFTLLPGTRNQRPFISVKSRNVDSAIPPGSCAGLYCIMTATGDANMVPLGPKSYAVPPTSALVLVPDGSMAGRTVMPVGCDNAPTGMTSWTLLPAALTGVWIMSGWLLGRATTGPQPEPANWHTVTLGA